MKEIGPVDAILYGRQPRQILDQQMLPDRSSQDIIGSQLARQLVSIPTVSGELPEDLLKKKIPLYVDYFDDGIWSGSQDWIAKGSLPDSWRSGRNRVDRSLYRASPDHLGQAVSLQVVEAEVFGHLVGPTWIVNIERLEKDGRTSRYTGWHAHAEEMLAVQAVSGVVGWWGLVTGENPCLCYRAGKSDNRSLGSVILRPCGGRSCPECSLYRR